MNYPYCGICRRHVDPAEDHVRIDVETRHVDDRDEVDDYVAHVDCARSVFEGWMEP